MSDHDPNDRFTATLLRSSAPGLAGIAASRLSEAVGGSLPDGFGAWREHLRTLILELAAAVEDGGSGHFAARVRWTGEALRSRAGEVETLREALRVLPESLADSLPPSATVSLGEFFEAATRALEQPAGSDPAAESEVSPHATLALRYVDLLRRVDGAGAIELVAGAVRSGELSIADALGEVLVFALREIGRLWHVDELSVAEEHFATQTTARLIERLVSMAPAVAATDRTVLLTMVEGDAHELGLRIVAAFFELDGWRTVNLGADTPVDQVAAAARRVEPDLLAIGATLNLHREAVERTILAVRGACPELPVLVGGPAFEGLEARAAELGAEGCALGPRAAVEVANKLRG